MGKLIFGEGWGVETRHSFKSKGSEAGTKSRLQDQELGVKASIKAKAAPSRLPGPEKVLAAVVE